MLNTRWGNLKKLWCSVEIDIWELRTQELYKLLRNQCQWNITFGYPDVDEGMGFKEGALEKEELEDDQDDDGERRGNPCESLI